MAKATFVLDDRTMEIIRTLAARRRKPQSAVVREAVAAFAQHEETLEDDERIRRLRVLDDWTARPRTRRPDEVDKELQELRRARRAGWRRRSE